MNQLQLEAYLAALRREQDGYRERGAYYESEGRSEEAHQMKVRRDLAESEISRVSEILGLKPKKERVSAKDKTNRLLGAGKESR